MRNLICTQSFHQVTQRYLRTVIHREIATVLEGPYNYVAGKKCSPAGTARATTVLEPALGKQLCCVPITGQNEVNMAVNAAKNTFYSWSQLPNKDRGRILKAVGNKIQEHLEFIAVLEARNTGKPIWEARADVEASADVFEYYGGIISSFSGNYIPLHQNAFAMICREPLGVISGIGVAPALACGNTMVFKPSPLTPITALILAELLTEANIPSGVFNIVQGDESTGSYLCQHPEVKKIAFTGSVSTGSTVMAAAAADIKRVTLELGGKSPLIIFEDADIINAVKGTMLANFLTQGQVCSNGTRVFVHESIACKFGAKVLYGGERVHLPPPLDKGCFLSPCILLNCNDNMEVVKKEVFGSVISILTFNTEEEVIQRANKSPFGLAGAVFTRNLQRAFRVARSLEAGTIWINNYNLTPPEIPFGGYKQSGLGRENGIAALESYSELKSIYVELGDVDCGPLYKE
ncbi:4-trimethylaminobutyraldehyde dehydrogenase [Blattella germanica]|nr:4-trimethylaminobutyraldehyde dehydrogenase [Blattella germanica]